MVAVVHCRKARYDIYIGRPSKWGNPFTLVGRSRKDAIDAYRLWILDQPELLDALLELDGKVLGCWCKPKACHGDVLVELLTLIKSSSVRPDAAFWKAYRESFTEQRLFP